MSYVDNCVQVLVPGCTVICCGSYRRGKPSSGDADVLITHPSFTVRDLSSSNISLSCLGDRLSLKGGSSGWHQSTKAAPMNKLSSGDLRRHDLMNRLLARLKEPDAKTGERFLSAELLPYYGPSSDHAHVCTMLFVKLPSSHAQCSGVHRRLDIKIYSAPCFPFALLYFTGSDHFNRSMRFYAKKNHLALSDNGLYPAIRSRGEKVWVGKSVFCRTERDVFEALGLKYVPPRLRNVYENFMPEALN